jgi:hypothetical protein
MPYVDMSFIIDKYTDELEYCYFENYRSTQPYVVITIDSKSQDQKQEIFLKFKESSVSNQNQREYSNMKCTEGNYSYSKLVDKVIIQCSLLSEPINPVNNMLTGYKY